MRIKLVAATFTVLSLAAGSALADREAVHDALSTGATSASSYSTSRDHKLAVAAQDDAGSFVASNGQIRGPFLEAAIEKVRTNNPGMQASDMDLANAILAKNAVIGD